MIIKTLGKKLKAKKNLSFYGWIIPAYNTVIVDKFSSKSKSC